MNLNHDHLYFERAGVTLHIMSNQSELMARVSLQRNSALLQLPNLDEIEGLMEVIALMIGPMDMASATNEHFLLITHDHPWNQPEPIAQADPEARYILRRTMADEGIGLSIDEYDGLCALLQELHQHLVYQQHGGRDDFQDILL